MRTWECRFDGIDVDNRGDVERIAARLGWSLHLGIHPDPPEVRHIRYWIAADDPQGAIERARLPSGVSLAEGREIRPGPWPRNT